MEYQEIINKCKEAYNNCDLDNAYKYWIELYNEFYHRKEELKKSLLYNIDIKNIVTCKRDYELHSEFQKYISQFSDKEVYDITDYGKSILFSE